MFQDSLQAKLNLLIHQAWQRPDVLGAAAMEELQADSRSLDQSPGISETNCGWTGSSWE